MAEESGLSYTIKFIPDTTEIDKSIKQIAERVSKELKDSIAGARGEAGEGGTESGAGSIGVVDNILQAFSEVKRKLTDTLKEFDILGGRSRSLQHPSSATVASVTQLAAQKIQAGDASQLSTDQILQGLSGALVAVGRVKAAGELMPGLSTEEAIQRSIQDQLGSLKGITEEMFGFKEFKSMKGLANMTRLADFYERSSGATGKGRKKEIEQGLMESFGHGVIQDAMKQIMAQEMGGADWEETDLKFWQFAKGLGMSEEDAKALSYSNQTVGDVVRKIGDMYQIGEAKTVGDVSSGVPKFARDIEHIQELLERTGSDVQISAKMYAGASRGAPARAIEDMKTSGQIDVGYEEIGEPVKQAIIRGFQSELPEIQRELQSELIDLAPGAAKAHVEQLLVIIGELMGVLEARSLPEFWMQIGVDRWIKDSAISYVNTLKGEIMPRLYDASKEMIGGAETSDTAAVAPTSVSERILGKLDTMDLKLDEIRGELPRGSTPTSSDTMLGSMSDIIKG